MNLVNQLTIPLGIEDAWNLLTDVEKIASCMPGAELTGVIGEKYKGKIKIKVGPISALFEGTASIQKDSSSHKAIISVDGSDTKGQGYAKGTITASLLPSGTESLVIFETEVTLTGRMASFGRNVMSDISDKLFGQFVECVKTELLNGR